jgi:signal transduction histidine kinase
MELGVPGGDALMSMARLSGGLRRRLVGLLAVFAAFAVFSASATIYSTHWYVESAARDFEFAVGYATHAERLSMALGPQASLLRAVTHDPYAGVRPYFVARDEFQTLMSQTAQFSFREKQDGAWSRLERLNERLVTESDRCLAALEAGRREAAQAIVAASIEAELLPEMASRLSEIRGQLNSRLNASSRTLASSSRTVLLMAIAVAALDAAFVAVGAVLIRRWLIRPIEDLRFAAERFATGDLTGRVALTAKDEFGDLGRSMNQMAESLTRVQSDLIASETKNRMLFQNLRDAVVLVDERGIVVEYHDSDTGLLGVEGDENVGRALLDVWPKWRDFGCDWEAVLTAAVREGRRYRAISVNFSETATARSSFVVDLLVYRVEFGAARFAAIVLRDVTDRCELERRLRQAETMEAVGTLASGLAHDFSNLLAGVIGNLSVLEGQLANETHAERIRAAVRTCWQASALSRRLLNFAGSACGQPQVFCVRDAVRTILDALDPSFLEGIEVTTQFELSVMVRLDPDQFTQSVLNLIRNAREAMPDGGRLSVGIEVATARHPDGGRSELPYAVLEIRDSGCGMTPEVQARVFEPFYTTKSRASSRGRGMGMAIVYAAVRNAGGFIRVQSEPQQGTSFRIYLPAAGSLSPTTEEPGPIDNPASSGFPQAT